MAEAKALYDRTKIGTPPWERRNAEPNQHPDIWLVSVATTEAMADFLVYHEERLIFTGMLKILDGVIQMGKPVDRPARLPNPQKRLPSAKSLLPSSWRTKLLK